MDNAQKAIMIGVGLFITIIIIAAVMLITGMGQDMINTSTQQVSNISTSLQAQLTSQYDDTILTGSQVISAIKANNTTEGMVLAINNGTGVGQYGRSIITDPASPNFAGTAAITVKTIAANTSPISVGNMTNPNKSDYYVPSAAKFAAHLIKISDSVVGVYFVKQ